MPVNARPFRAAMLPRAAALFRVAVLSLCAAAAASALLPGKAEAWWFRGPGVVVYPPVYAVPPVYAPPVVYAPPPSVLVRPGPRWVRPYFDARGFFHPGHWA